MARFGTHIPGTRKPIYSSWISRSYLPTYDDSQSILTICSSVGVGFSYADYGETVETTEDAAKNIHAFISIFFETFPQFSGKPLHLSGESYGV
jgi:carboxypeptidase C (cathepsin A)